MKQIKFFTIILFFWITQFNGQTTDVITGLHPFDLEFNGNDLYIADYKNQAVVKIDITEANPSVKEIVSNFGSDITALAFSNNNLYFAYNIGIKKIDISSSNPNLNSVVTEDAFELVLKDNYLYVLDVSITTERIYKINILSHDPQPINVLNLSSLREGDQSFYPTAIAFSGNNLYFSEFRSGKVFKIDMTDNEPVKTVVATGINGAYDLLTVGDILYVAGSYKVYATDISGTLSFPNQTLILENLNVVRGLASKDDYLYIGILGDRKIVKFDTSKVVLDIENHEYKNDKISIHPNPSNSFVQLEGLDVLKEYTIYNTTGNEVKKGIINGTEKINVQDLSNGLYFLKLKNGTGLKFTKN